MNFDEQYLKILINSDPQANLPRIETRFLHPEYRDAFVFLERERKSGAVSSEQFIFERFGIDLANTPVTTPESAASALVNRFKVENFAALVRRVNAMQEQVAETRTLEGVEELGSKLQAMLNETTDDYRAIGMGRNRAAPITVEGMRKATQKIDFSTRIETPFPTMNRTLKGFLRGELVVISARPNVGKTWVGFRMCLHAVLQKKKVLIVTPEMSKDQTYKRLGALKAGIEFSRVREGNLTEDERLHLDSLVYYYTTHADLIVAEGDFDSRIDDVEDLVAEHKPDLLFVDSFYILKLDKHAKNAHDKFSRVGDIFERLKNLSKRYPLTVLVTTQVNRDPSSGRGKKKIDGERVAFSDAITQSADYVIALDTIDEDTRDILKMYPVKSRDAGFFPAFEIDMDLIRMRIEERGYFQPKAAAPDDTFDID